MAKAKTVKKTNQKMDRKVLFISIGVLVVVLLLLVANRTKTASSLHQSTQVKAYPTYAPIQTDADLQKAAEDLDNTNINSGLTQ